MERRGFLKTLVSAVSSSGLLLRATPAEVQAFGAKPEQPVILSPQEIRAPQPDRGYGAIEPGATLYDASGRAVAIVGSLNVEVQRIDVTSWADSTRQYVSGVPDITIVAHGLVWPEPRPAPRPAAWVCAYCRTNTQAPRCPSCGAPRS